MSTVKTDAAKIYAEKPYTKAYGDIWADIKDMKGIVTKSELVKRMQDRTGKPESACASSVGVILSPRETSKGDCRGNSSAKGHLYYFAKVKRKVDENGEKEEQRYRFFWRKDVLDQKGRNDDGGEPVVEAEKTAVEADEADAVEVDADAVEA
jgi:hypothetical protein